MRAAVCRRPGLYVSAPVDCSLLLTACPFARVPGRTLWCTTLGAGTLYGYLLHGFVLQSSRFDYWYDQAWTHTPGGEGILPFAAGGLITLMHTRIAHVRSRPEG
ncbi:hypothetical protein G3I40_42960 [Streptomyces sp. SID14478]|uniref:hypothetical protein n=1 Tax=Streptomyces sp. SID14478 TaxID=2706073 RepID=UPI0013DEE266|nr:hypothetical protein [Streptomyces sp. SID14478]